MNRRQFLKHLGLGVVAGWAASQFSGFGLEDLTPAWGASPLRIAFLSDAHLLDGDARRPPAQALGRAVTEINALRPLPTLVLFGGDLAHQGDPDALELGQKILSGLRPPLRLVMGEHDGSPWPDQPWPARFGSPRFSFSWQGFHFLGIHTAWEPDQDGGGGFRVGAAQREWLQGELATLPSSTPLIVCSHAPLYQLYKPWQYWTEDAEAVQALLSPFGRVTWLHGHVHQELPTPQGSWTFQGLPATAWPLPDVRQGTPARRPAPPSEAHPLDQHGCGWALLTFSPERPVSINSFLWRT